MPAAIIARRRIGALAFISTHSGIGRRPARLVLASNRQSAIGYRCDAPNSAASATPCLIIAPVIVAWGIMPNCARRASWLLGNARDPISRAGANRLSTFFDIDQAVPEWALLR